MCCITSHLLSRHPDARLSNQVTQVPRSNHLQLWDKMFLLLLCVFVTLRQVGPSPSPRWSWNTFSSGIHTLLEINKQTIDHIIDQDNAFWVNVINHCTNLGTFGQVMVTLTKSHIVGSISMSTALLTNSNAQIWSTLSPLSTSGSSSGRTQTGITRSGPCLSFSAINILQTGEMLKCTKTFCFFVGQTLRMEARSLFNIQLFSSSISAKTQLRFSHHLNCAEHII